MLPDTHIVSEYSTFVVTSGAFRVTDPCYDMETWCAGTLDNVLNGEWQAQAGYYRDEYEYRRALQHDPGYLGRVAYLSVVHSSAIQMLEPSLADFEPMPFEVGVDSGQAGFFDLAEYEQSTRIGTKQFYRAVCNLTSGPAQFGTVANGVVASSGYGDGVYPCLVRRNYQGQIEEAVIIFIEEDSIEEGE